MSRRFFALLTTAVVGGTLSAQSLAVKSTNVMKTPDGVPDLQGVWTNETTTPLERPKALGSKEFYTPEEAAANEQKATAVRTPADRAGTTADVHYDVSQYGLDRSHSVLAKTLRTSLITGPDGTIPPLLPQAQKRIADKQAALKGHQFDSAQTRPLGERCILWPNEGPPMLPAGYNANLQIVQGKGYVAILQEMIHDVRVIPTDNSPHVPENIRLFMGDSRGHWEGNTLVVDTTNFTDRTAFRNSSEKLHVVERFTRTDANTITYQFTVDDPTTWEKSWSAEIPMTKVSTPIYEYACQEANYGMANILSGARSEEKKAAAAAAAKQ